MKSMVLIFSLNDMFNYLTFIVVANVLKLSGLEGCVPRHHLMYGFYEMDDKVSHFCLAWLGVLSSILPDTSFLLIVGIT